LRWVAAPQKKSLLLIIKDPFKLIYCCNLGFLLIRVVTASKGQQLSQSRILYYQLRTGEEKLLTVYPDI